MYAIILGHKQKYIGPKPLSTMPQPCLAKSGLKSCRLDVL